MLSLFFLAEVSARSLNRSYDQVQACCRILGSNSYRTPLFKRSPSPISYLIVSLNIPHENIPSQNIIYHYVTMQRNVIGSRVRQARRMSSPQVSQVDLVARLQVLGLKIEQSAISKIENGQRPVLDTEVALIAKALDVSVAWLLGETNTPKKSQK